MARMHSRKKGKSTSKKPIKKAVPVWIRYKQKEIEMLISKLAKEGNTASKIGTPVNDTFTCMFPLFSSTKGPVMFSAVVFLSVPLLTWPRLTLFTNNCICITDSIV